MANRKTAKKKRLKEAKAPKDYTRIIYGEQPKKGVSKMKEKWNNLYSKALSLATLSFIYCTIVMFIASILYFAKVEFYAPFWVCVVLSIPAIYAGAFLIFGIVSSIIEVIQDTVEKHRRLKKKHRIQAKNIYKMLKGCEDKEFEAWRNLCLGVCDYLNATERANVDTDWDSIYADIGNVLKEHSVELVKQAETKEQNDAK